MPRDLTNGVLVDPERGPDQRELLLEHPRVDDVWA
jgi:hypothetical protein